MIKSLPEIEVIEYSMALVASKALRISEAVLYPLAPTLSTAFWMFIF